MAKTCVLTGRNTSFGRNVSHSKRRTNRQFEANTAPHRLWVPELNRYVKITLSARGLRTVDKHGGLVPALRAQGKTLRDIGIK